MTNSENCLYGLSQNSFNSNQKSKRSADLELNGDVDWTSSSSLNTLTNFNLDLALKGETVTTNLVYKLVLFPGQSSNTFIHAVEFNRLFNLDPNRNIYNELLYSKICTFLLIKTCFKILIFF